jgi:hypothetical protein
VCYEVEPRVVVDESGYVMECGNPVHSFATLTLDLQMLSHILTVYGGSDQNRRFIARNRMSLRSSNF